MWTDRLVYRRRYLSPEINRVHKTNNGADSNSWDVLYGNVNIHQAIELAQQQGYDAQVGEDETELILDYGHSLICAETGALNNSTSADRSLFQQGMIWWESDGSPITDEEDRLLGEAYQQSRIPIAWNNPGDALLIDNRRIAHGREPYSGPRRLYQLLGSRGRDSSSVTNFLIRYS